MIGCQPARVLKLYGLLYTVSLTLLFWLVICTRNPPTICDITLLPESLDSGGTSLDGAFLKRPRIERIGASGQRSGAIASSLVTSRDFTLHMKGVMMLTRVSNGNSGQGQYGNLREVEHSQYLNGGLVALKDNQQAQTAA